MEVIRFADRRVINILGEPKVCIGEDKRFIKNCLYIDVDDGKVIFNGLTRAIVFIKNDELDKLGDINTYAFLYKNYFFVNEDFDEYLAFEKIRQLLNVPLDDIYLNHPFAFTIITTTKCNARCFYCYENTLKNKHNMSEETALKVAKYILDACPQNQKASLTWFGGEPLYNAKVINIICDYLRDNGKEFSSTMSSNAYLFDERLVKKAKNSWNLEFVQITIDGLEEDYNRIKNYINKDQISPYKKVINSINALLKENIKIDIRINIDPKIINDNPDYYVNLIKELNKLFGNSLTIYVFPLFDDHKKRSDEENKVLFSYMCYLEDLLNNLKYSTKAPHDNLRVNHCMADNSTSIIIDQDGNFSLCEHYIDESFSNIDNPCKKDKEIIGTWKEYLTNRELCEDCPILGECHALLKCPSFGSCNPYEKEWNILKYVNGLNRYYQTYKSDIKLSNPSQIC